ncbi:unnamed protein product [Rotaria sordida]|uniref:RING-type domain-containing protein n=1 Tax=Rotaria sordida TaxID=392033 RepID=A0A814Y9T7_9BILA|nr:unnamed protein product [Rotaria sordida]CAF1227438.1 unnamed protein product [Rotaria sordida]CAF3691297.1 unnamed protein product [Rotaria sordida]CAF4057921.1 unnamed protein product [Rotaria sordida]
MGKAVSKLTRSLGYVNNKTDIAANNPEIPATSNPPQWDTTIDQLFGDAPPDDNVIATPDISDVPIKPKRRRRSPPPPPSTLHRGRRRHRGAVHSLRTPIVPEMPRRCATGRAHALNRSFGINRRPIVVPAPITERERSSRTATSTNFKRRPSSRRRRLSSQRSQRLQELLQCPVCLTPFIEPRLLPCGHTYCDECLNRLMQNNNDVVTCPECRKQHLVPDDGVFPPNFVVRNLLDEQAMSTCSRLMTPGNLSLNTSATAKCTTCETFAPLRLCRHCNFMVCDRCLRAHRYDSNNQDEHYKRSKILHGKLIQFYVAVRKITSTNSQVKRLTIEMPVGNYVRDTCETLIRRVAEREQLSSMTNQLVLEFGDKRLRPQRTLASYGVQTGDLLFLFNPDQRLNQVVIIVVQVIFEQQHQMT